MVSIEVIIRDESGKVLNRRTQKVYELGKQLGTVDEIEAAVEGFRLSVLPEIEADCLEAGQSAWVEEAQKKKG